MAGETKSRHNNWRGWRGPLLVLLLGGGLTAAGVLATRHQARVADQQRFETECEELWKGFEGRLQRMELKLRGIQEFCAFHLKTPAADFAPLWESRIQRLNYRDELPGLWEIGYAALEDPGGVAKIAEEHSDLRLHPDLKLIVQQRERLAIKPAPTGDNLYDSAHAATIWRAWQEGETRATGRVELGKTFKGVQRLGYRLMLPVFDEQHSKQHPRPRGVVFAAILLDHVLVRHFDDEPRAVEFEVFAGSPGSPDNQLTGQVARQSGAVRRVSAADSPDPLRFTLVRPMHGAKWTISFRNTVLFTRNLHERLLAGLAVTGGLLAVVMAGVVRLQTVRQLEAEAAARAIELSERKVRREAQERERLVRDLHERTIQSLFAVSAQLVNCAGRTGNELRDGLEQATGDLEAAVNEVRDAILRIGPATEAEVPFAEAVILWLDRLNRGHGASLTFESEPALAGGLDVHARAELTAMIREAVSNALRHGRAERVAVSLRPEGGQALLSVHDDGDGFDPGATASGGHGLKHLRQRAKDLGGECIVESRPGGPTLLRVRFPLPVPSKNANPVAPEKPPTT